MVRTSAAARKAKAASSQVPPAQVPLPTTDSDHSDSVEDTTESVQSVTNAGTQDEASTEQDSTEQDSTEQDSTEQDRPGEDPAGQPTAASTEQSSDTTVQDEQAVAEDIQDEQAAQGEPSLDEDPITALVGNIYLHLLSEHDDYESLHLDDDVTIARHAHLHEHGDFDHPVEDWRFRPSKALAVSLRDVPATAAAPDPNAVCVA